MTYSIILDTSNLYVPKSYKSRGKVVCHSCLEALISVPFQPNYDHDIGVLDEGERWTLNIQPVVPIGLNQDWNIISRTILPVIYQDDIFPSAGSQTGIGDVVQSVFFSPKEPTTGGWIWGAGQSSLKSIFIDFFVPIKYLNIMNERKMYNTTIDVDLIKRIKILAAQLDKRQNDLLEEAIQDLLKKKYEKKYS